MDRRSFLKNSCNSMLLGALPGLVSRRKVKPVRFGIVTDLHYAGREPGRTRYYQQSTEKLQIAIYHFNQSNLDFIMELGDFKDQDIIPERESTLGYLEKIEKVFRSFNGPVHHVLGNHDMDSISKDDFLLHIRNSGQSETRSYYSFVMKGIKFIILDANYRKDESAYNNGDFDWTEALIPREQQRWLCNELSGHSYPVIVFIHQLLDSFSGIDPRLYVLNADEVRSILEEKGNVLAVIQGHHHPGHYSFHSSIHYWTVKGAIEGSLPENNSFAIVEIDPDMNILIQGFYNCENRELIT